MLLGLRDFQDDKADVILKYTPDEARMLKQLGDLPESAKVNEVVDLMDEFGSLRFLIPVSLHPTRAIL